MKQFLFHERVYYNFLLAEFFSLSWFASGLREMLANQDNCVIFALEVPNLQAPAVEAPAQGSQVERNEHNERNDKQFHPYPLFCMHQSISLHEGAN
jgi:hypothetical protein